MNNKSVLMKVQSGICDAELHPDLVELKAGQKRNWIRCHYIEFKKFYDTYGPSRTMQRYGITRRSTLDAMLSSGELPKLDRSERALLKAEQAVEAWKGATHRIDDLEAEVSDMRPMARLGVALVEALCKFVPGVEYHPIERPDRLRLE